MRYRKHDENDVNNEPRSMSSYSDAEIIEEQNKAKKKLILFLLMVIALLSLVCAWLGYLSSRNDFEEALEIWEAQRVEDVTTYVDKMNDSYGIEAGIEYDGWMYDDMYEANKHYILSRALWRPSTMKFLPGFFDDVINTKYYFTLTGKGIDDIVFDDDFEVRDCILGEDVKDASQSVRVSVGRLQVDDSEFETEVSDNYLNCKYLNEYTRYIKELAANRFGPEVKRIALEFKGNNIMTDRDATQDSFDSFKNSTMPHVQCLLYVAVDGKVTKDRVEQDMATLRKMYKDKETTQPITIIYNENGSYDSENTKAFIEGLVDKSDITVVRWIEGDKSNTVTNDPSLYKIDTAHGLLVTTECDEQAKEAV